MNKAYIAVDIGASSGRLILGWLENEKLQLKEIHRFKNSMTFEDGHYRWNVDGLFREILNGLVIASDESMNLESIGIDTWAVDYVLLNDQGERVAPVFAYRDHRTDETMAKVYSLINQERIYEKTGIQFLQFNTLYQLYEHVQSYGEDIQKAESFLMVPDYLNYKLSGIKAVEYTNATSTQLLNVNSKEWDQELLEVIGVSKAIMPTPIEAGSVLGGLTDAVRKQTGIDALTVIAPATHDTGSAIVAIPALEDDFAYISSGTWSLMGIESLVPIADEKARAYNITNEGGVFGTYRVLKNIMGLWLIQEVVRIFDGQYSFAQMVDMAMEASPFGVLINPNDPRFLNPENMIKEIQSYCEETKQKVPETPGEIARCIFESLAYLYRMVLEELREVSDQPINRIHIIGGGCQNKMLNKLCADFTGCTVYAGPIEATAIGNLAMQMITMEAIKDLKSARALIKESFEIEVYEPVTNNQIEEKYEFFKEIINE